MAKRFALMMLPLCMTFCGRNEPAAPTPAPPRASIGVQYAAAEIEVRSKPDPNAPLISKYRQGEAVSILGVEGEWTEVRIGVDKSGWARTTDLTTEKSEAYSDPNNIRFRVPPSPIYSQSRVRGEIALEANVDTAGNVLSVRTVRNTTGSPALEAQNKAEVSKAKFWPMRVSGKLQPFVYEYSVEY